MFLTVLMISLASLCAASDQNISVVTMQLDLGAPLTIFVSNNMEYILEFRPGVSDNSLWRRLRVNSDGGDATRPLLLVLRQDNGARTWQLPYKSGDKTLYEMERTLCAEDLTSRNSTQCTGTDSPEVRGAFSLHVSTRCVQQLRVTVLAYTVHAVIQTNKERTVGATMSSAAVLAYRWSGDERGVLVQASSDDVVCGGVVVQHLHGCPIEEFLSEVSLTTMRMSMLGSAGVHVERYRFPNGFLIISMVYPDDVVCKGVEVEEENWLWEDAVLQNHHLDHDQRTERIKSFTYNIDVAISPRSYIIASVTTLAVLAVFYIAAGVMLLLQRFWPGWRDLVPRAALLVPPPVAATEVTNTGNTTDGTNRRRRNSADTYDGSDVSDTDSDDDDRQNVNTNNTRSNERGQRDVVDGTVQNGQVEVRNIEEEPTQNSQQGAPPLRLAALSRRRARTLRARAARYPPLLITICVFYALPVFQLLATFQLVVNTTGSLDNCYYNFLCSWRAGALADFNHIFSNLAYLLLGTLLLLHLRKRRLTRRKYPQNPEYGIPEHYGLLAALGLGMMAVALMSAAYHVCPNRLTFQFDTAFMYVLAVLINVKLYQTRHPDINARAHATFAALAVLIVLAVWGVLGGGPLFWAMFTVIHVFSVLLLSLQVYYVGQFKFEKPDLSAIGQLSSWRPQYKTRLLALSAANLANWGLAIYGLVTEQSDFAGHLLTVLLANALFHMMYYLLMKLVHKERLRWYSTVITVAAALVWLPALYFFTAGSSDWSVTPAQSRSLNHRCLILEFYDAHDLWHLLSAVALYLSFCAILTWDDGLAATPREQIPVF